MLKVETIEVSGFKGMRNPYNSWDKSDSKECGCMLCDWIETLPYMKEFLNA